MIRALTVVAALVMNGTVATAQSGSTHRLTELADGVYAVQGVFQGANAAIIVTERDVLVVDSHGSPASATALLEDIAQLTDKPVRYVVNTHWHVDHHTGNQAYYQAWPEHVEFVAHRFTREDIPTRGREQMEQVRPFLEGPMIEARQQLADGTDEHGNLLTEEQRARIERFADGQEAFLAATDDFEFRLPDLTFDRRLVLHRDQRPIEVRYFHRAHTRGDVVVYLPEDRILIAGDLTSWRARPTSRWRAGSSRRW
jgi:glyoxylase-like metal-dependent hydrolase (beta-lactamase superfamily II)